MVPISWSPSVGSTLAYHFHIGCERGWMISPYLDFSTTSVILFDHQNLISNVWEFMLE